MRIPLFNPGLVSPVESGALPALRPL